MAVLSQLKDFVEDHHQKVVVEDSEIQKENKVQMQFLKKSVDALNSKLQREQAEHMRNRVAVMEINQNLIFDISGPGGLQERIKNLKEEFSKEGGTNELTKIMKKMEEHEKMMREIEESENNGGMMPSSQTLGPDATSSHQIDPIMAQEI